MKFVDNVKGYVSAAFLGGLLAFVIEAADRIVALWPSFNAFYEPLEFAAYLAPTIWLGAAVGIAATVVLVAVGGLRTLLASIAERRGIARPTLVAGVLSVFVIGVLARLAIALQYTAVAEPMLRLAQKVNGRIAPIPFVINHFGLTMIAGCFAVAACIVIVEIALATRQRGAANALRYTAAVLGLALMLVVYTVDSRLYFGRYELTMHLPLMGATLLLAFLTVALMIASRPAERAEGARMRVVAAVALLSLVAGGVASLHMGRNKNVKALVWRRSIIARRAYQGAAYLADRDRDGFAAILDGADLDDGNPSVNPLATEIPANGIDDNCIGGDAPGASAEPGRPGVAAAPAGSARNFILVSIDTLRADRMSCYGYGRPTATGLEEFSKKGVFFERAYSQGTNTGQSFASMQRSATRGAVFDDSRPSMFGRLAAAGFTTTIINARRDDAWLETKRWARYRKIILDGVSTYDHVSGEPLWDGDGVTDRAIEYLSALDPATRHATWVHYLDPHEPRKKMAPFDFGNSDSDKYDSEVAYADREVVRFLKWLESSGRMRDTIVVLLADHGESFLDHGMDLHGNRPYNEQIHVPLMMWAPDVAPARVAESVGILDVAPTVLEYLGLESIPGAEGRDILRSAASPRPMFSETPLNLNEVSFFAYSVTEDGWRYIYDVRGNTEELYDLATDPTELHNRADTESARLSGLRATLAGWLDSTRSVKSLRGV